MSNEINTIMRELIESLELKREEVEFLTKENTFAMKLDRIAVTEEQATQTFSHESPDASHWDVPSMDAR